MSFELPFKVGTLSTRAIGACLATGALACAGAGWWHARATASGTSMAHDVVLIQKSLHAARSVAPRLPTPEKGDFALRLPVSVGVDATVRDLQRASSTAGVAFASFAAAEKRPTVQALGRLEMRVALRGSYGGTTSVLAEVAARQPSAVVQRVTMRRNTNPIDLDMQIDLLLLSRPLSTPSGS
jgi:hypothetical protein